MVVLLEKINSESYILGGKLINVKKKSEESFAKECDLFN